jgi:hypothetical protein
LVEGQTRQIGIFDGPYSDIGLALGMGETSISRVYQGWYSMYYSRLWPWSTEYHEWTQLGEGDNLDDALIYAINHTDWIPNGPHDNFRLMGQGDLTDLRIE